MLMDLKSPDLRAARPPTPAHRPGDFLWRTER